MRPYSARAHETIKVISVVSVGVYFTQTRTGFGFTPLVKLGVGLGFVRQSRKAGNARYRRRFGLVGLQKWWNGLGRVGF